MFSIAIPAIKPIFLEKAIKSVIEQDFQDYELILINYSQDKQIDDIVNRFPDKRIKYINNLPSTGIINDWNNCLNYANREYFILFSDDDIYEKNFLTEVTEAIKRYPDIPIFRVRTKIIDENDKLKYLSSSAPEWESCADFIWHRLRNYRFHYISDFIFKTSELKTIGGFIDFPDAWYSDDATNIKLSNINGIVCINKFLFNYRESQHTISKSGKIEKKLAGLESYNNWLTNFVENELKEQSSNDKYIIQELHKAKQQRFVLLTGNIISIGVKKGLLGFWDIFHRWFKFRKKYKFLNFVSLIWAFGLHYRKYKGSR